ncbi:MAG: polysaccharide lyase family protein [Thermoguttaceae bacterium]
MKTWALALFFLFAATTAIAAEQTLWEIGKADHDTAKFALGPKDYKAYRQPGFFVVGHSDPKKDWPYVQPGIVDGWAPGKPQTFEIFFALANAPQDRCRLELHFADTHSTAPPRMRVEVDGVAHEYQTPQGGGDASVFGDPSKGRPSLIRIDVPAATLKPGTHRIAITTLTGSWVLWDAVRFLAPSGVKLADVHDLLSSSADAPKNVLVRHEGKTEQPVVVRIVHTGQPTDAELHIGDRLAKKIHLQTGVQKVEAFVPPMEKGGVLPVTLSIAAQTVAQAEVSLAPARKWEVYILMHSHNDIGYTDIQPNIAKKQAHNVLRALELIRQTKDYPPGARFKWNLEVLMPYEDFHAIATPEQEKEFEQAVREGSIGIDAMYANLLTGVCRSEELVRQFSFATALGRRCGVKVDSMAISDVPGLTWGVVPALAQYGVKYISDGPNANPGGMDGDRIGYVRVQWEYNPFYWLSPSGREKVLYWGAQGGYSIGHGFPSITAALPVLFHRLDEANYPYDIVQLRWTKGDNGPPDEAVMEAVRQWNAKYAYPRLIIATTSEAFHAFEERYGDKLPTYRGDLTPYWEDGAASGALETALNRHSADRLLQAETLWALLCPLSSFPAADFAAAWKNVALWSEHTWGAYNSIGEPDLPFVKNQWKFKQAWALDADRQSRKLLEEAIAGGNADGSAVDVFNTSSWPRTELVSMPKETKGNRVKDDHGQGLPSQRLSTGELVFLARDVPPFAARRFTIDATASSGGSARAEGLELKTSSLSLKVDAATGAIASLKQAGVAAELAAHAINSYIYLPGGNVKDARPNGPARITVKEAGPLVASLVAESDAPGCKRLVREVRVIDGLDRVEIIDMVDKLPVRAVEGVHFGFAFNVPNPEVRINSPGAVVRPEKDQLPGACKNWFSVERWVDVSNDNYGVTWVTADAPLVELGGLTANLPRSQPNPNAYMKTIEPSATLYSWAMNNHWHTNYRADQEGETTFRYYLRPHGVYDAVAAAHFGLETTQPLIVVPARGEKPAGPRLRVEPADVLVAALKPSDDGKAIIVRLYGASGKDIVAKLDWSEPAPKAVWLSDGSEQALKSASDAVEVPAWGLVTLRAELP